MVGYLEGLKAAADLIRQPQYVHVVEVFDRTDGIYVFADLDDAVAFEEAVDASASYADLDVGLGFACIRTEEIVVQPGDAHVVINAEREE